MRRMRRRSRVTVSWSVRCRPYTEPLKRVKLYEYTGINKSDIGIEFFVSCCIIEEENAQDNTQVIGGFS